MWAEEEFYSVLLQQMLGENLSEIDYGQHQLQLRPSCLQRWGSNPRRQYLEDPSSQILVNFCNEYRSWLAQLGILTQLKLNDLCLIYTYLSLMSS